MEILLGMLRDLGRFVRMEVEELDAEALRWRPHPNANSIGVTVWHLARWFDLMAHRFLRGGADTDELWQRDGWASRTGYDPRGIGTNGYGAVTGYTVEEVARIPEQSSADLLAYYDACIDALARTVNELGAEGMAKPPPGAAGERTALQRLTSLIEGEFGHLGEIRALKSLRDNVLRDASGLPPR